MDVNIIKGNPSQEEIQAYVQRAKETHPDKNIRVLDIELDGDFVNLAYHFSAEPFERIRRITGYLVGTLDRFNDAKRAEVEERVKHDVCCG